MCRDFEAECWLGIVRPVGKHQSYGADFPKPRHHADFRKRDRVAYSIHLNFNTSYVYNKMEIDL